MKSSFPASECWWLSLLMAMGLVKAGLAGWFPDWQRDELGYSMFSGNSCLRWGRQQLSGSSPDRVKWSVTCCHWMLAFRWQSFLQLKPTHRESIAVSALNSKPFPEETSGQHISASPQHGNCLRWCFGRSLGLRPKAIWGFCTSNSPQWHFVQLGLGLFLYVGHQDERYTSYKGSQGVHQKGVPKY